MPPQILFGAGLSHIATTRRLDRGPQGRVERPSLNDKRLIVREGLSAPRFALRSRRRNSPYAIALLFGGSVAFGFIAWTIVRYMWPYLRARTRAEALRPLLVLHGLRFVGLSFRYQASWRREGMGDARAVCGESRAYRYKD